MSHLNIYRASAGSGKTYTLSGEFIKLLMEDPQNYKYILAVTFTNKATSEMKHRILENLYTIACTSETQYIEDIIEHTGKTEPEIRKSAKLILFNILNDFSRFSISTIDSFFQKVIRSFAFEAGLPAGFKVELDSDRVLKQAVDDLIREIDLVGNEDIKKWLITHALAKIEEGGDWNISTELVSLGREVFKEEFQSLSTPMLQKLNDKSELNRYHTELKKLAKTFENTIKELNSKALKSMNEANVTFEILKGKSRSPLKRLEKLANFKDYKEVLEITVLERYIDNPDECCSKTTSNADRDTIMNWYNGGFNETLIQLCTYYNTHKTSYFTAKAILQNINALGIITDIANKVRTIAQDENLFLLADANRILYRIIDENETPFIYEKIGSRFHHYMIDEFQDTSNLQWNNFKPLIDNSISQNNTALIVGDVKQSIYRWRNSDWKLLSEQVEQDMAIHGVKLKTLTTNWRSSENVIHFNNAIFKGASKALQLEFNAFAQECDSNIPLPTDLFTKIENAYFDTVQEVSPKALGTGGKIKVHFLEKEQKMEVFQNGATEKVIHEVEQLLEAGYQHKDICILVRKKAEGQIISEALLSGTYSPSQTSHPVISNETLLLGSSPAVNLVIQQLKYIQAPDDDVSRAYSLLFNHFYKQENALQLDQCEASALVDAFLNDSGTHNYTKTLRELKGQPLFEMVETLIRMLPDELYKQQYVFLQGLLDTARDYVLNKSVNAHDFISWWEDKGKKSAISVPSGQNAIQVMTIHKSKGLEFKAVIIPYCNWPLDERKASSLMWCKPTLEPFNAYDLLPINYSSSLLHSEFVVPYLNERLHQYVDNLNLLYVAFTRSCETLIVMAEQPSENRKLANASHLLLHVIEHLPFETSIGESPILLRDGWNVEDMVFDYGIHKPSEHKKEAGSNDTSKQIPFKTSAPGDRICLSPESITIHSTHDNSPVKYGKIMHALFEHIQYADDVEKAAQLLIQNGKIKNSEKQALLDLAYKALELPQAKPWFDAQNTIINEGTILDKNGTYRPDRVVVKDNKATVIDYKFGELHNPKYKNQVANYMNLLTSMGYKSVEGYVWYVGDTFTIDAVFTKPTQGTLF